MPFLFERFWYPFSQTAGTHEPQRTSWGRCSGRVQLFPMAKEQQMLVLWDRNPFFQLLYMRPMMDKPHSSCFWLAPPSVPSDLYSLFFVPPHLTLFSFLASLQLSVPPLCPCTGKTPQFSKHICCCQAPFGLFFPTQAPYSSSIFWLPSSSHCQLSLSEFLPSLLRWDCSWLNPQIITSWPNPKASCLSLALTCFHIHCSWPLYPLQFTLFSIALGSCNCFEEWLASLISEVRCSVTALAAASSPCPPNLSI